ncbi:hypothetical protein A2223_01225, partial [Candidatus Falkowbacteria bacterium RIFOXYA2_FULL_35_8]
KKLLSIGAKKVRPETLMKRVNFYPPNKDKKGWMRIRDEGNKITLSYKRFLGKNIKNKHKIDNQQEILLLINNFNEGIELLEALGAKKKAYQETKREEWHYSGTEISIDTWPGLKPFIEIEAKNEKTVKKITKLLGFDYSEAIFGPVGLIYEKELNISQEQINNHTPEITFKNPPKLKI